MRNKPKALTQLRLNALKIRTMIKFNLRPTPILHTYMNRTVKVTFFSSGEWERVWKCKRCLVLTSFVF